MRTQIKILAVFVLLLAGCFALSSQKSFLIDDIYPLLAQNSDSYQFYTEEKLELESWMTEDWEASSFVGRERIERETDLQHESWMITLFSPVSGPGWDFMKVDAEAPQKLEEWMICCSSWTKRL